MTPETAFMIYNTHESNIQCTAAHASQMDLDSLEAACEVILSTTDSRYTDAQRQLSATIAQEAAERLKMWKVDFDAWATTARHRLAASGISQDDDDE